MRRRAGTPIGRVIRRTTEAAALIAIGAIVWVQEMGLPKFAADRIRATLVREGIHADFDLIRLELPKGFKVFGVRIFDGPADRHPRFHATWFRFGVRWLDLIRRRPPIAWIYVRGGHLRLGEITGPAHSEAIERIRADVFMNDGGFDVEGAGATWRGLSILADGRIEARPAADDETSVPEFGRMAESFDPAVLPLAFPGGGEIGIRFHVDPGAAVQFTSSLEGRGDKLVIAGVPVRAWSLSARANADEFAVDTMKFLIGTEQISASGKWTPLDAIAEAKVAGSIPPELIRAIPLTGTAETIRSGLRLRTLDPIRFSMEFGPAPADRLADRIRGSVGLSKTEILGVWMEQLSIRLERDGRTLRIPLAEGIVGRGRMVGPLRAEGEFDLQTRDYRIHAKTEFSPHALMPWLDPIQALHVGAVSFRGEPPRCTADVSGRIGDIGLLSIRGDVEARDMTYNGALLSRVSARMAVSNQTLRIDDIHAERTDGSLRGSMEQDFQRRIVRFDIDSSIPLNSTARLCGPFPHRFVAQFRAEGASRIRARGQVDYGAKIENAAVFSIEAESFGIGWCLADRVSAEGFLEGRHVALTNLAGSIYGGSFDGRAAFDLPPDGETETRTRYDVSGWLRGAEFASLLHAVTDRADHIQEGQLTIRADLKGFIGVGQGKTATGSGSLRIRRGILFEIPLFGELSKHLSSMVSGAGFVSQGDFKADVRVADGRVTTQRAELIGDLLTLRGQGIYSLDRSLDFIVEAKLLRGGVIADVVRFITLPVTRFLSYDLSGTLNEPRWSPRNVPVGLFTDIPETPEDESENLTP